jgi:hypothetical protein
MVYKWCRKWYGTFGRRGVPFAVVHISHTGMTSIGNNPFEPLFIGFFGAD